MRRPLVVLVVLALMASQACRPTAASETIGGELSFDHEPASLSLRPGETSTFHLTVTNVGDRYLEVFTVYLVIKCPGGTSGRIRPSYLELEAGGSAEVTVDVTSHANMLLGHCLDETNIRVLWGPDLALSDGGGGVDRESAEGREIITLELHYEPTLELAGLAAVIAVMAVAVLLLRSRRGRAASPQAGDDSGRPSEEMER